MSALHCPATLLLARHAEAEYDDHRVADLGGSLTPLGRRQARALGESLRDRRVAQVYTSPMARAVQTAEIAAAVLDVHVSVREDLREWSVGDLAGTPYEPGLFSRWYDAWLAGDHEARVPGGESGTELLRRTTAELAAIGDAHPGETVLVVSHAGVLELAAPWLATNLRADHARRRPLAHAAVVELAVDADGWLARAWDNETPSAPR